MDLSYAVPIDEIPYGLFKCGYPESDDYIRVATQESMRPWFEARGYFLYDHSWAKDSYGYYAEWTYPLFEDVDEPPRLPYSHFGGEPMDHNDTNHHYLQCKPSPSLLVYAQDSRRRHVAMKLVEEGSIEYNIYRRLSQEKSLFASNSEEFGCVISPLDFLEVRKGLWFIVMPKWGTGITTPWFNSIREVLVFMRCMMKGMTVLHKNLIVHRDIKSSNVLVNHFAYRVKANELREQLRSNGLLSYALMDFDHSAMFPLDSEPSKRRLPASESFVACCFLAWDTAQGEIDYDPFAFDVGSLGMFLCEEFQHLSPMIPMLAPFLDRMITRDIPKRFTAFEALQFFEDQVVPSITAEQLHASVPQRPELTMDEKDPEVYDRWAGLDPAFVTTWHEYKLPRLPWWTWALRHICEYVPVMNVVRLIRWMGRTIKFLVHIPLLGL